MNRNKSQSITRPAFVVITLFLAWLVFSWGLAGKQFEWSRYLSVKVIFFLFLPWVFLAAGWIFYRRSGKRFFSRLGKDLLSHAQAIDNLPAKNAGICILLASGLSLFLELLMIRLQSSFFQLFAYYKNVSLLSCFLGLGIGFAVKTGKRLYTPLVMPLLFLQVVILYVFKQTAYAGILQNPVSEQLTMGLGGAGSFSSYMVIYGFILFVFILNTLAFIPVGALVSRLMKKKGALSSYSWNLAGSLLGILLFSAICYLWAPPSLWIMAAVLLLAFFLSKHISSVMPTLLSGLLLIALLGLQVRLDRYDVYSPYQILTVLFKKAVFPEVRVNNVYLQHIVAIPSPEQARKEKRKKWFDHYSLPYLFKKAPHDVLIVGSGTGNDAASARYHGAGRIDAVEIDPAIVEMGKIFHPAAPYQAGNVKTIVNDARNFIRNSENMYDLIIYGLLDSHTLLSGMSSVRLDSYVYTVESFREAGKLLKPDGVMSLSFYVMNPRLGRKLFLMLEEAFDGRRPVVYRTPGSKRCTFLIGKGAGALRGTDTHRLADITGLFADEKIQADKSTDDWPFFYMPVKKYPVSYLFMLALLLFLSLILVFSFLPDSGRGMSLPCFFLGAGFMLIETKAVTELALVFGSTWFVNSIVIGAILIMAFAANLIVQRRENMKPVFVYGLLGAAVLIGLLAVSRPEWMNPLSPALRKLVLPALLTLPLFFSGFAFSGELKRTGSVSAALSSNLLGSMLGGFLEYNSMVFGFRSLYILSLVLYGLAFLFTRQKA